MKILSKKKKTRECCKNIEKILEIVIEFTVGLKPPLYNNPQKLDV